MPSSNPWSVSEPISVAQPDSRDPALAIAGETPHLLWAKDKVIYHSVRGGESWSAPVRVATGGQPAVVATPDGKLHCVYANQFAGNFEIYYVAWDGTNWSLPEQIPWLSSEAWKRPSRSWWKN